MKPFTKRLALVTGLLFTALICMGIVFIDTTQNYWYVNSGFVKLIVSNQTSEAIISVDTNTFRVGIKTNNTTYGVAIRGALPPPTVANSSLGTSADPTGEIFMRAGDGGDAGRMTTATGNTGGPIEIIGGTGGSGPLAVTNNTAGSGGNVTVQGGGGGGQGGVATNTTTGGTGGTLSMQGGNGGAPNAASTNALGGNGGSMTLQGGAGGSPSAGWSRRGGGGGAFTLQGGSGGTGVRTNGGTGGSASLVGGDAGSGSSGGNAGASGVVSITGGGGATGNTNSDGGHVFIAGGAPGSGAVPGNVVLARTSGGTIRGAVGVRVPNPQQSLDVQGSTQISSNLINTNLTILAATNSTANTNITVNFDQAVTSLYLTNHASFTNVVNLVAGKSKSIIIFITAVGGPYNLVFPTLGGASFGTRIYTNANSPIWGSVTNKLAVSITSDDTNAQMSMTEWK